MSFKALAVFTLFLFAIALVNAPPAAACDTGGVQPGNPTFSFTQAQPVYAPQAFVQQPVVTQQFVAQPQYVQQFVAQPVIQRQVAVHHQAVVQQVVAQPVLAVRQPRRQVTRSATVTRSGGILGFRN
jgi:ADP-glucose pyrophosphorylase